MDEAYQDTALDPRILCFASTLLDLASVGGLIAGLAAGTLPAALAVGYCATLLGGLTLPAIVWANC